MSYRRELILVEPAGQEQIEWQRRPQGFTQASYSWSDLSETVPDPDFIMAPELPFLPSDDTPATVNQTNPLCESPSSDPPWSEWSFFDNDSDAFWFWDTTEL